MQYHLGLRCGIHFNAIFCSDADNRNLKQASPQDAAGE